MGALERRLHRSDGVARVTSLQAAGHSRHQGRRALAHGRLVRLRRDWVALPGADHELSAAAAAGVVLTCVSQARRPGLWTMTEPGLHVATGAHGAVPPIAARVHWAKPIVPRHPDALTDPVENVLALVAACRPFEEALVVWESALRTGLVQRDGIGRLPLGPGARKVLDAALSSSDSGLETLLLVRLRWLDVRIVPQAWIDGRRVDALVGDRLVVQIDGGHHVGAQRDADNAHDARLALLGFRVMRFGYRKVVDDWPAVQDAIVRAVAQGLHRR